MVGRCELGDQYDDEESMGGYGKHHGDALASDGYGNGSGLYCDGAGGSQRCGEADGADGE